LIETEGNKVFALRLFSNFTTFATGETKTITISETLTMTLDHLAETARKTLINNWKGTYSVPSNRLYPFQWNWDSGFVAIGMSHFRPDFATLEIQTLFDAQWENGMVPHIIFHDTTKTDYFPNYDFWDTDRISGKPAKYKTSGITQPPVHGFVLEHLDQYIKERAKAESFFKELFPKVKAMHAFFYRDRDPNQEGLVYIFHPWESGRDNSPLWTESLERIQLAHGEIPAYSRYDNTIADPTERPTSFDYDRYVYLMQVGKSCDYDGKRIAAESPFLIQDAMFNAILIRSNESLINLGKKYGLDVDEIETWQAKSIAAFDSKFWNERLQTYCSYDLIAKKQIALPEIGGLCALFAGIPGAARAEKIAAYLNSLHQERSEQYFLCPSFDPDEPLFDPKKYWQGPIWPQMNWLIYQGLKRYGFNDLRHIVRDDLLTLMSRFGLYEYFDPRKKMIDTLIKGYGGNDFSWTSAMALDLIENP
jgi:glycogen debranching enzyme